MSGTPDSGPGRNLPPRFAQEVGRALRQIARDPNSRDLLGRFRIAYKHKRDFPWLRESKEEGLTHALAHALGSYGLEPTHTHHDTQPHAVVGQTFRSDLRTAIQVLIDDPNNLRTFAHLLKRRGQSAESLKAKDLIDPIRRGIQIYSSDPSQGTGLDPW